ncbi:MAG: DNA polymerase III subunit [Patescibacteria group bacterium]|nr:DNA polymerase III subunit [Patescibacteria group bacterium]
MIIGHQKIWQFLKKTAQQNKLAHAYLFYGPEKIGKKTLALEFIKLLNCQNTDFKAKPCQNCRSCRDIQKGQHPDLFLIQNFPIQISQIRELIWRLSLKPYSAPFKAAIIDQAHLMTKDSQSCFLKTLEEPKGKAILILISETPQLLLPTILSRVQKIRFLPVKKIEIENYLRKNMVGEKEFQAITKISLGRPGVAKDLVTIPQKLENYQKAIKELIQISNSDLSSRFQYVKDLSKQPNLIEILNIWLSHFRNILIEKCLIGNIRYPDYSLEKLKNILKKIQSTIFLISTTNVNPRLALEILMLEL